MYTQSDLDILIQQEQDLRYDTFHSIDAFKLGEEIIKQAEKEDRGIVIQIIRESDGLVIFQYVMDDKAERNFIFCSYKHEALLEQGHSSAWMYVNEEVKGNHESIYSGGAFPIRDQDNHLIASLLVSGLHEGKDHHIIVHALENVLNKNTVSFTNELR
jgi:uncharacterized protein (UPF0303 family)